MSIEELLKKYILGRYGTLKAFCVNAGIATSTMDSILHRGVLNARIETMIKICRFLGISLDALTDGSIAPSGTYNKLSAKDLALIDGYNALSDSDRETVDFLIERAATKREVANSFTSPA